MPRFLSRARVDSVSHYVVSMSCEGKKQVQWKVATARLLLVVSSVTGMSQLLALLRYSTHRYIEQLQCPTNTTEEGVSRS